MLFRSTTCKLLNFGREKVKRIAVCSGGGSTSFLTDAINMGADLYLTGEHKELYHTAKDGGINVIFAGQKDPDDLILWMNACDILVLPSLNEGLPNV